MKNSATIKTFFAVIIFWLAMPGKIQNEPNITHAINSINIVQIAAKRTTLSGRWSTPPKVIICENVVSTARVTRAVNFWKRLGYKFGEIRHETDTLTCAEDIYWAIKITIPSSNDDMTGKIAITQTTRIEPTNENISATIKIWTWGIHKDLVLEHEIGHALGWLHTNERYHIMFPEWVGIGHSTAGVSYRNYVEGR